MSRPIRLVAVDMDYTLLNSNFEVSERNRQAISGAVESGVIVTLATGRMYCSVSHFAEMLGIDAPLITYNGAYIRLTGSDRVLSHIALEQEHAVVAIRFAASEGIHCNIYVDDRLYMSKNGWEAQMYTENCRVSGEYEPDLEAVLSRFGTAPTKILLIGERSRMNGVQARLTSIVSGQAYVTSSIPEYVEMMNKRVSKGKALELLSHHLHISPQEVMAIGDSHNDIDMLRYAGTGVAMANSPDEVKAAASFVVPSNDEDGVAVALEQLSLKEGM